MPSDTSIPTFVYKNKLFKSSVSFSCQVSSAAANLSLLLFSFLWNFTSMSSCAIALRFLSVLLCMDEGVRFPTKVALKTVGAKRCALGVATIGAGQRARRRTVQSMCGTGFLILLSDACL